MGEVGVDGGGKPTGGVTQGKIFSLWLGGKPFFAEARDWYLGIARRARGPVGIYECHGPLLGKHLAGAGIEVRLISAGRAGEADAATGHEVVGSRWETYAADGFFEVLAAPLGGFETLWRRSSRVAALKRMYGNLTGGGRLVLDARNWGEDHGESFDGLARLALDQRGADGSSLLLWETWRRVGASSDAVELGLGLETVNAEGIVKKKKYARFPMAILNPSELEEDARSVGFKIEGAFGGFSSEPPGPGARPQVWVLRKPPGAAAP